jgi:hypothetical protein
VTGLAMVGYGIYLLVEFSKASDAETPDISPVSDDSALIQLGRPMLMAVSLSDSIFDKLPKAWYAYCSFPLPFLGNIIVFCYILLQSCISLLCVVWFGGIDLGPGSVLLPKVSGSILSGANLGGLI